MVDEPQQTIVDDVEAAPLEETEGTLKEVVLLARQQLTFERAIAKLEKELERLRTGLKEIREVKLPATLEQAGLRGLDLDNGWRVELNEMVTASIPKARRAEGIAWCEENEARDLVKHTVKIDVGRQRGDGKRRPGGGERAVRAIMRFLQRLKFHEQFTVVEEKTIAPQTLMKMVRDRLAERARLEASGANYIPPHLMLPEELLGVYRVKFAELAPPKRSEDTL